MIRRRRTIKLANESYFPLSDAEEQSLNELMSSRYWQVGSYLDHLFAVLHRRKFSII